MIKEWTLDLRKKVQRRSPRFLEEMSLYPFVDEPFAEMHRMLDEALHTIDHGIRNGATQHAAPLAQAADQQIQRQGGERRNPDGFRPK